MNVQPLSDPSAQPRRQPITQHRHPVTGVINGFASQQAGLPQAHDIRRILRSRSQSAFMTGTKQAWLERYSVSHKQGANAFRGVELVPRDRQQIDPQRIDRDADLADTLGRIRVQENIPGLTQLRDFTNRLECADFVVRMHDADQTCVGPQGRRDSIRFDDPLPIARHDRHTQAEPFQEARGLGD